MIKLIFCIRQIVAVTFLSSELRHSFLNFFRDHSHHTVYPSAPIIPAADPTLLFTSAGMVPFKDYFVGLANPPHERVVSCQKCVRAGGKHNDLEQVGWTRRHHTFFEMLGNFSFGNYFKEEAITWAWSYLTGVIGLDPKRLWITVYHTDDQAASLWKRIAGVSDDRILKIDTLDNFWSAGDTGPCGPCSEIFYDCGPDIPGGLPGTEGADGDRFVEVWNLVFMEFDQKSPQERVLLPRPSIDTGMGLERLAAIVQGVYDNFETDIFQALIQASRQATPLSREDHTIAHRVIADHVRSIGFLMAEGVVPAADGRGYVLRRMIRRALRYVHTMKGSADHLARLLPTLSSCMGQDYPELVSTQEFASALLAQESERFMVLLDQGLHILNQWMSKAGSDKTLPGKDAFMLYDTMGFPIDLTQDILQEKGFSMDREGFDQAMEAQKMLSRSAGFVGGGENAKLDKASWQSWSQTLEPSVYTGPDLLMCPTTVVGLLDAQEQPVAELNQGDKGWVIVTKTPFYAESGGQQGDTGSLECDGVKATVEDVIKRDHLIMHRVFVQQGKLCPNLTMTAGVDPEIRARTAAHHSATHLLQAALREILGRHVMQKGSKVGPDKLRFDFSHRGPLSADEWSQVEHLVNQWIRANTSVSAQWMEKDQALATGAMALFGETYGNDVRVVAMGDVSKELCGGTHVAHTGTIGFFKIISETAVASGVRRIEAVVGLAALECVQQWHWQLKNLALTLKTSIPQLNDKLQHTLQQRPSPSKDIKETSKTWESRSLVHAQSTLWHVSISADEWGASLPTIVSHHSQRHPGDAFLVTSVDGATTRVLLALGNACSLVEKKTAPAVLKEALGPLGWTGGGRPERAQGGGHALPDHARLVELISQVWDNPPSA